MANANLEALTAGYKYRLEIHTANLARAGHSFHTSKATARKERDALRKTGFVVSLFTINSVGGLEPTTC